jgi:hypothetical protein
MKKEIKDEKIIEKSYSDLENDETDIINKIFCDKKEGNIYKDENNLKEINEKINDNIINNKDNLNNKLNLTSLDKIKVNLIKIEPKKLDESLKAKDKEIMESINPFIDDFQDGKNIYIEENHSDRPINLGIINKIKDNKKEKESNLKEKEENNNSKDYNIIKRMPKNKQNKRIYNRKIMYIYDLKEVLKNYKSKRVDFKVKIKCRIKTFFHSYNNFYVGCSNCHKKIRNNINCCKNRKEELMFSFYLTVRDASGVVNVFIFDRIGRKLMNMSAKEYKELLDNKNILSSSHINNLYDYEYLFTLEFWEPRKIDDVKKKYNVFEIEIINKKHKYELVKELKNILKINC